MNKYFLINLITNIATTIECRTFIYRYALNLILSKQKHIVELHIKNA